MSCFFMISSWMEMFSRPCLPGNLSSAAEAVSSSGRQVCSMQVPAISSGNVPFKRCGVEIDGRDRNLCRLICSLRMFSRYSGTKRGEPAMNVRLSVLLGYRKQSSRRAAMLRPNAEGVTDLEFEIFCVMQKSSNPDAFPTREDLISGGREDLVRAIVAEKGWLAAGWDYVEQDSIADSRSGSKSRSGRQRDARSSKQNLEGRKSKETSTRDERLLEVVERMKSIGGVDTLSGKNGRMSGDQMILDNVNGAVHQQITAMEPREGELQVTEDMQSLFSFMGDLKLNRQPRARHWGNLSQPSGIRHGLENELATKDAETILLRLLSSEKSGQSHEAIMALTEKIFSRDQPFGVQDSGEGATHLSVKPKSTKGCRRTRRKKLALVEVSNGDANGSLDWIAQMVDQRAKLMLESMPSLSQVLSAASSVVEPNSMRDRVHAVETRLVDIRAALQLGREELWVSGNNYDQSLSELVNIEDALEFREDAIVQTRSELSTTRAQVTALEGKLRVEIMEAQKTLEEKIKKAEKAQTVLQSLRTARIVWPYPASQVQLTGSFDGWNKQIKMEQSNAGVFVVALPLYPGSYEIKFIVDGWWRVDTKRPIVYVGGYENNVLVVT